MKDEKYWKDLEKNFRKKSISELEKEKEFFSIRGGPSLGRRKDKILDDVKKDILKMIDKKIKEKSE